MNWEDIILDRLQPEDDLSELLSEAADTASGIAKNLLESPHCIGGHKVNDSKDLTLRQWYTLLLIWHQWTAKVEDSSPDTAAFVRTHLLAAAHLSFVLGKQELRAGYLILAGDTFYEQYELIKAEKLYTEALHILEECENDPEYLLDFLLVLDNLGDIYSSISSFEKAEKTYKKALTIARALAQKDPQHCVDEADILNNLGELYFTTEKFQKADEMGKKALEKYRTLAEKDERYFADVAMILQNLGVLYSETKDFSRSRKMYIEALRLTRECAEKNPEHLFDLAFTLKNMGNLYEHIKDFSKAKQAYSEALQIMKKCAHTNPEYLPDLVDILNDFGNFCWENKELSHAEDLYVTALNLLRTCAKKSSDQYNLQLAIILHNLGNLYSDAGNFSKAEHMYTASLAMHRDLTQKSRVYLSDLAMVLDGLGSLYSDVGRFSEAEYAYTEALHIYQTLKDTTGMYALEVAGTLNNLGLCHHDSEHYEKAEPLYKKSLAIKKKLAHEHPGLYDSDMAATLHNMGLSYVEAGKFQEAEYAYTEALHIKQDLVTQGYKSTLARTLFCIGNLYKKWGKYSQALQKYTQTQTLQREEGLWIELAKTCNALSKVSNDTSEEAVHYLEVGILFSGEKGYIYSHKGGEEEVYLHFLGRTGSPEKALGALEALRSPGLLSKKWDTEIKGKTDCYTEIKSKELQKKLVEELLKKDIPPNVPQFEIPDDMLFLYIQKMEDHILYLAVTTEGIQVVKGSSEFVVHGRKLLLNLGVQVKGARAGKDFTDIITSYETYAAQWIETLPSEIVELLLQKDSIVFSPDAVISSFPVEGIYLNGVPLCLSKPVVRATSMHQFKNIISRHVVTDSSFIIGNPWPVTDKTSFRYEHPSPLGPFTNLKKAETEAQVLADKLPHSKILLNTDATAQTFLDGLETHSIIHFAGHGYKGRVLFFSGPMRGYPPEFEAEEFSILRKTWRDSPQGHVYMMDEWDIITDTDINTTPVKEGALIFLNACETAQYTYAGGGHFQGLAHAFLQRGASHVISSLIPLFGEPARDFALSFYDNLTGTPVAGALQNTRQKIKKKYKAPIYWLPYIHYGSPCI